MRTSHAHVPGNAEAMLDIFDISANTIFLLRRLKIIALQSMTSWIGF